jgi:UDP-glucose 4-epimerase
MNIFITGIAGFLGSNLADYFIQKDKKNLIGGCDNLVGGDLKNLNKKIIFYKGNCEDFNFVKSCLSKHKYDLVIHAAALAHEGLSVFSPSLICSNNVSASASVFSAAIAAKVKKIIYCSSMARYGTAKIPYREDCNPLPCDPYGISKLAAEKILINLCEIHKVDYNIIVPHNIVGRNQTYNDPFRNVASIMVNKILLNERPIIYGDGKQKRSFTDVRDCVKSIDQIIVKKIKSQIINIGPGEHSKNYIEINDLFGLIANKLKYNQKPIYFQERPQEIKYSLCSSDKQFKLLDYEAKYTVEDSVDSIIEYIKKMKPKKFKYRYQLEILNNKTPLVWAHKII